ncbi:hypothetical protein ACFSS8_23985 [Paracoccus kondratievae]
MNRHSAIDEEDLPAGAPGGFPGLEPAPRSYQSWVADETIEDYALRYAPASHRRWSPGIITHTALGAFRFWHLRRSGQH